MGRREIVILTEMVIIILNEISLFLHRDFFRGRVMTIFDGYKITTFTIATRILHKRPFITAVESWSGVEIFCQLFHLLKFSAYSCTWFSYICLAREFLNRFLAWQYHVYSTYSPDSPKIDSTKQPKITSWDLSFSNFDSSLCKVFLG